MKVAIIISRILLGLMFVIFGLHSIVPFIPTPHHPEGSLAFQFLMVFVPSHWMSVAGVFQLIGGVLVLLGGTAPLGLLLLAPVLVNILCFHICLLNGEGIVPGLVLSVLEVFLLFSYRNYFRAILTTKAKAQL